MFIVCDRDALTGATSPALCAIANKGTVQALEGLLLTADKDEGVLTICGYDMEKGVKVTLSGEDIQIAESGKIIINAAKFSSILKNLPAGDVSVKTDENMVVTIRSGSGRSEFIMHGLDGSAYPLLPDLSGSATFQIRRDFLRDMIAATHFAVAVNSSRPSYNGALFEINQGNLNLLAVDGYRVALRRSFDGVIPNDTPDLNLSFIMPGKSLSELLKLIGNEDSPADIQLTRKHVIISFENIIFFSRLIESEFIDYKRWINVESNTTVTINTKDFIESVERASLLTDDRQKCQVKLTFVKDGNNSDRAGLQITSVSTLGSTYEECDIEMDGEDIKIAFNHRYLLDALKACGTEKITLRLENPTKSVIILPYISKNGEGEEDAAVQDDRDAVETSEFVYLVLPVMQRD